MISFDLAVGRSGVPSYADINGQAVTVRERERVTTVKGCANPVSDGCPLGGYRALVHARFPLGMPTPRVFHSGGGLLSARGCSGCELHGLGTGQADPR